MRRMSLKENRLTRLVTGLLSQGITPHKVALTLALGVVLGVNPIIGTSTTLLTTTPMITVRITVAAV